MQESQPGDILKQKLRIKFAKGTLAAGNPSKSQVSMNLHQLHQWEKVPVRETDSAMKIASNKGNFLRLPVYRIKSRAEGGNAPQVQPRTTLNASANFKNRESSDAVWQLDEPFDPLTNGNFRKTEVTQSLD